MAVDCYKGGGKLYCSQHAALLELFSGLCR